MLVNGNEQVKISWLQRPIWWQRVYAFQTSRALPWSHLEIFLCLVHSQENTSSEFHSWHFPSSPTLVLQTFFLSWAPLFTLDHTYVYSYQIGFLDGPLHGGRCPTRAPGTALHMWGGFGKAVCLPCPSVLLQGCDCLWHLFPGVRDSASKESGNVLVLDMFNRRYQDALKWFKDNLPKSSEAYCALEVGHPREQLLFIYPAGACHQINISKCLPARNKYLAGKRKYTGSLTGGLHGEHEMPFFKHIKNDIFINYIILPLFIVPLPPQLRSFQKKLVSIFKLYLWRF